mgnify:CR=1 FL=1|jgi:hypothetical protein
MRFMSKLTAALAIAAALLVGGRAAQAQTPVNPLLPVQGTTEIFLNGDLTFEPGDSFNLDLGIGPFLNRNLQVGGILGVTDVDGGDTTWRALAFANWHFPGTSQALPYIGVQLGYVDFGPSDSFTYGIEGGVKYFLNSNVSANAALRFLDYSESGWDNEFGLRFGISAYISRGEAR